MWIYLKQRDGDGGMLYTVGFFDQRPESDGHFVPVEDFSTEGTARSLVHYLNGGDDV